MKKIKQWVRQLSVKKKLILYGYLTITPVLVIICLVLLVYNYNNAKEERFERDQGNVDALADSIYVLQTEIKDFTPIFVLMKKSAVFWHRMSLKN